MNTNLLALFMLIPLATWLTFITSVAIPYVSTLITPHKTAAGYVTPILSLLSGILSDLALPHSDWKVAVGTAVVSWFIASKWHARVLSGTQLQEILENSLIKPRARQSATR